MKKLILFLSAVLLLAALTACRKAQPTDVSSAFTEQPAPSETQAARDTMVAYRADGSIVSLEDCGDGTWKAADGTLYYPGEDGVLRARGAEDLYTDIPTGTEAPAAPIKRQDGERFEAVIMIEGMEETVQYEHVRNEVLGFEMDYEYESFVRRTEAVCDRFTSMYDDPDDPQNYFEVSYSAEDADTIAASVRASLSDDYEIIQESYMLERAGECIRIDASAVKGGGWMPDQLQMVYIIPAADGCRIAAVHYASEGAEGFGIRLSRMMDTLEIIERDAEGIADDPQPAGNAAGTPTPTSAAASAPRITKSPTGETVDPGGTALFIARGDDATRAVWHFVDPDRSQDIEYTEAAQMFSGLDIIDADTGSLILKNIPESLNGWSVYCRFSNAVGSSDTERAVITVNAAKAPEQQQQQASFDYTGTFTESRAGRGTLTITGSASLYEVSVDWYEGSTEYITTFSGTFSDTGVLSYSNACLTVRFEDGSHDLRYTGGTGSLSYVDSGVVGVYWTDDQSEYDEDNFFFAKN